MYVYVVVTQLSFQYPIVKLPHYAQYSSIMLIWQTSPSSYSPHEGGGSSKGLSLKCNYQGNLQCVMLTLHTCSG